MNNDNNMIICISIKPISTAQAISLHAATDEERDALLPVNRRYSGISRIRFIHSSNMIPCSSNVFFVVLCLVV